MYIEELPDFHVSPLQATKAVDNYRNNAAKFKKKWSAELLNRQRQLANMARKAYSRSSVYENWYEKYINVKVGNPKNADAIEHAAEIAQLDKLATELGFVKKTVDFSRSIIYEYVQR